MRWFVLIVVFVSSVAIYKYFDYYDGQAQRAAQATSFAEALWCREASVNEVIVIGAFDENQQLKSMESDSDKINKKGMVITTIPVFDDFKEMTDRTRILSYSLKKAGIPHKVVPDITWIEPGKMKTLAFILSKFTGKGKSEDELIATINGISNGIFPAVFINGWVAGNPSTQDVVAAYQALQQVETGK